MGILFLCTDAYGGHGGIAKFNRDLCRALSAEPLEAQVTALPRVAPLESFEEIPSRVDYRSGSAGSKLQYVWSVLRTVLNVPQTTFNGIICGHINLLPVAVLASWVQGTSLLLILHGIDAWTPHPSPLVRWLLPQVDTFVAVSQCTKDRFLEWAPPQTEKGFVVPDCIDPKPYGPGPKREDLLGRYGLENRTILLT